MKIIVTYEKCDPTTVSDHAVSIKYLYTGTEEEISKIEEQCRDNIGTMLVLDASNTSVEDMFKR